LSIVSLLFFAVPSVVQVTGESPCPTAAMVEQRLWTLASLDGGAQVVELRSTERQVTLVLLDSRGRFVAEREFTVDRPCDAMAGEMAIAVASWLSDLEPEPLPAEPLPKPVGEVKAPVPKTTVAGDGWALEVATGPTASLNSSGFAPGVLLEVAAGPSRSAWRVAVVGGYEGPHQMTVTEGQVQWDSWQFGGGGSFSLTPAPWRLELLGYLMLSDVRLSGSGFAVNETAQSWNPGITLAARLLLLDKPWHPWVELGTTAWIRQEVPSVGVASSASLPQVTGLASIGLAWQSN
jgi:hypothetical protein